MEGTIWGLLNGRKKRQGLEFCRGQKAVGQVEEANWIEERSARSEHETHRRRIEGDQGVSVSI